MAVSEYALCSLAELKAYLGLTGSAQDSELEDLVDAATAQAEAHTARQLKARDYEWVLDGDGGVHLLVPEWPINSISLLKVNGVEISARTTWNGSGYVIAQDTAGLIVLSGYVFWRGVGNVEISANAGYATVPGDLKQAVIELAAWKAKQSSIESVGQNWLGKQSDAKPRDMGTTSLVRGVPREIAEVLDCYARRGSA